MTKPLRFLVAESEPEEARNKRRASVGRSSGETYIEALCNLVPGTTCHRVTPADPDGDMPEIGSLAGYDAIFLTGSPLHLYEGTPETRRQVEFMRAVFASGTPAFGSCAGLQVATVAAGGTVRTMRAAPFARGISPGETGSGHPLLTGRPARFDAPAIHADEVEALPSGALPLAGNDHTTVQAAEIRQGDGVFWGVQYHPELPLAEVAAAVRRDGDTLVRQGTFHSDDEVDRAAEHIEELGRDPSRADLADQLRIDAEVVDPERRRLELLNFMRHLVLPTRSRRGRQ